MFSGENAGCAIVGSALAHQHSRVRDKLNLSGEFVIHSLRHTMLTRLGEAGVDAFAIMRIAGHSRVTVSQRYVHLAPEAMERAFEIGHSVSTRSPLLDLSYAHPDTEGRYFGGDRAIISGRRPSSVGESEKILCLAQFHQDFFIKIRSDPKPGSLDQLIKHGSGKINESGLFRFRHDPQETAHRQASRSSGSSGSPFIHKQEVGLPLNCKHNCLCLAGIQILAKLPHAVLVHSSRDSQPWKGCEIDGRGRSRREITSSS